MVVEQGQRPGAAHAVDDGHRGRRWRHRRERAAAQMSMSAAGPRPASRPRRATAGRDARARRGAPRGAAGRRPRRRPARATSRRFRSRSASENGSERMALQRAMSSTCAGSVERRSSGHERGIGASTRWPTHTGGMRPACRTPPLCPMSTASMRRSSSVARVATDSRRVWRPSGRSRGLRGRRARAASQRSCGGGRSRPPGRCAGAVSTAAPTWSAAGSRTTHSGRQAASSRRGPHSSTGRSGRCADDRRQQRARVAPRRLLGPRSASGEPMAMADDARVEARIDGRERVERLAR